MVLVAHSDSGISASVSSNTGYSSDQWLKLVVVAVVVLVLLLIGMAVVA